MTSEEVKKLTEIQYKIDGFNKDIRRIQSNRLTIYVDGSELYYGQIPNLKEDILGVLLTRVMRLRDELQGKLDELVICTANTKTNYKPINLTQNE